MEDVYQQLLDEIDALNKKVVKAEEEYVPLLWIELGVIIEVLSEAFEHAFAQEGLIWTFSNIFGSFQAYLSKLNPHFDHQTLGQETTRLSAGVGIVFDMYGFRNFSAHSNIGRDEDLDDQRLHLRSDIKRLKTALVNLKSRRDLEQLFSDLCMGLKNNPKSKFASNTAVVFWGCWSRGVFDAQASWPDSTEELFQILFNTVAEVLTEHRKSLWIEQDNSPKKYEISFASTLRVLSTKEEENYHEVYQILQTVQERLEMKFSERLEQKERSKTKREKIWKKLKRGSRWTSHHKSREPLSERGNPDLYILKLSGQVVDTGRGSKFQISNYVFYYSLGKEWKLQNQGHFPGKDTNIQSDIKNIYKECGVSKETRKKLVLLLDIKPVISSEKFEPFQPILKDWNNYRWMEVGPRLCKEFFFVCVMVRESLQIQKMLKCAKRSDDTLIPHRLLNTDAIKHVKEKDIPTSEAEVKAFREGLADDFEGFFSDKKILLSPKGQWLNRYFTYNAPVIVIDLKELEYEEKGIPETFTGLMTYLGERTRKEGEPQITCILSDVQLAKRASFSNKVRTIGE